jgi:hypothetical protein
MTGRVPSARSRMRLEGLSNAKGMTLVFRPCICGLPTSVSVVVVHDVVVPVAALEDGEASELEGHGGLPICTRSQVKNCCMSVARPLRRGQQKTRATVYPRLSLCFQRGGRGSQRTLILITFGLKTCPGTRIPGEFSNRSLESE